MKLFTKTMKTVCTALCIIGIICLAVSVLTARMSGETPKIFGYELRTVLSGSMEPVFRTGSIIAIKPKAAADTFKAGDIITYRLKDNTTVTHRIIEVQHTDGHVLYKTKGDRNNTADLEYVLHANVIGRYTGFTIPYVGYLFGLVNSKGWSALLLIVPGILLISYSIRTILQALRKIDMEKSAS